MLPNAPSRIFVASGLTEQQEVKLARVARGLKQTELAALAHVPPWAVSSYETAYRRIPRSWKQRIRAALDLEADNAPHV